MTQVSVVGVPDLVRPEDFPEVASQYVSVLNQVVHGLLDNLRELSEGKGGVETSREYGDVLDRINSTASMVTKLMDSVSRLKIATPPPAPPKPPAAERMAEVLEGVKARMIAGGLLGGGPPHVCPPCTNCGAEILAFPAIEPAKPDFI